MSVTAFAWARDAPCKTAAERAVLTYLADCINEREAEPTCYPGQAKIAAFACLAERQTRKVLNDLRERGLIKWTARGNSKGGRSSNRYRLNIPDWGNRRHASGNPPQVTGDSRQVTGSLRQVTGTPPPIEPEKNQKKNQKVRSETGDTVPITRDGPAAKPPPRWMDPPKDELDEPRIQGAKSA